MVTLEHIGAYLSAALPKTVGTWDRTVLHNWLAFQWAQRGLAVVTYRERIIGVAVAVRCEAPDMDDPWTPWNDRGNCVYIHQVAASSPVVLKALMSFLAHRLPEWESLRLYAFRHGRSRRIKPQLFARTWRKPLKA